MCGRGRLKPARQRQDLQAMEDPGTVLLVHQQVTEVRHRHTSACNTVAVHPQGHLLRHHAAREERRGLNMETLHQIYEALVLTVDTPVAGARLRDVRNGLTIPPSLS